VQEHILIAEKAVGMTTGVKCPHPFMKEKDEGMILQNI
jgi:hypothetical protein